MIPRAPLCLLFSPLIRDLLFLSKVIVSEPLTVHPLLAWPLKILILSQLCLSGSKKMLYQIFTTPMKWLLSPPTQPLPQSDTRGEMQTADGPTSGERLPVAALSSYFQFSRRRKQSAESFHRMRLQLQWLISRMYVDEPAA